MTWRDYRFAVLFAAGLSLLCTLGPPNYGLTVREFMIGWILFFAVVLNVLKDKRTLKHDHPDPR